jgi:signal transduction histidine kinase
MRERVERLGGTLHVGAGSHGAGLVVTARLPCAVGIEEVA